MEYVIIEQMMELALSNVKLESKLNDAVRLIADFFSLDQCAVYLWDGGKRMFTLKAARGRDSGLIGTYGEDEGLPGLARKKGFFEVRSRGGLRWEGVEDRGLEGFRSAFVHPLKDRGRLFGLLYCKSEEDRAFTPEERRAFGLSALQIVSILKCADLVESHDRIHEELLEMQTRLMNAEKLMALGDMAATLAHDIRNPLISIGGFALRLKRHLEPDSPGIPYVEQMVKEIGRVEKIMNGMIRFLKDSALELQPDDMNEIIEDALRLFDEEISVHGIKVVKDLSESPLPVMADREQIKIAFDNIIANAIQSISKTEGRDRTLTLSTGRSHQSVFASIRDTGGGIDPRHIAFIFNPFFTTKKQGTGLGLSITNSIIMRHKGAIEIDNVAGVGVTFTVKLPYAEKKAV